MLKSLRVVLILLAVSACEKSATTASPAPASPTSAAVQVYVCEPPAYRPPSLLIACGDGNVRVLNLRWSLWTARSAEGTGTWQQNDCKPDCARGQFRDYPVRLHLDHPIAGQGSVIFGDVSATFPKAAPPQASSGHEVIMRNGAYGP